MRILTFLTAIFVFPYFTFSQVDEEVGFIYMKGEYLMQTQRYNDAIAEYTRVIRLEADYKDALLKRAKAQYELGAYRGVQEDVLEHIKLKGINYEAIALLGSSDHQLGNHTAAVSSLSTALRLNSKDAELRYLKAKSHYALGEMDDACTNIRKAISAGVNGASSLSKKFCAGGAGKTNTSTTKTTTKPKPKDKPGRPSFDEPGYPSDRDESEEEEIIEEIPEEPKQPYDDSVNKVEVDEDLTLIIKNGIGGRKIEEQPNILILSDDSGMVAIDVCVNEKGKVISAELNPKLSDLDTRSIISLATRKAKEFWFDESEWPETCGTILFEIGSR